MTYKKIINNILAFSLIVTSILSINSNKAYAETNSWDFNYTGNYQTFTVPYRGTYKIELWGASGGTGCLTSTVGKGSYVSGIYTAKANDNIYIYVGGKGNQPTAGYNGGGTGGYDNYGGTELGGGGGGATDIRTTSGTWNNSTSLKSRIAVAGGGGGAGGWYNKPGYSANISGSGGASLGIGANGLTANSGGGGGGGGYYGGTGGTGVSDTYWVGTGGKGGTSYTGSLSSSTSIAGNLAITSPTGSTETGHTGNGYARITLITKSNILDGQTTIVIGTFDATTIDVSIPAVNSFLFNSDTNKFDVQNIKINNNSSAPVYANLKEINIPSTSNWIPNLVAPTTYNDTAWNNLNQTDTKSKIALGVSAIDGSNWLNGILNKSIWSTDTSTISELGAIQSNSSIEVVPTMKSGTAITTQKVLTANYIFEFGLQ